MLRRGAAPRHLLNAKGYMCEPYVVEQQREFPFFGRSRVSVEGSACAAR